MMGGVFAAGEVLGPFGVPRIMASSVPAAARPRVADRMPVGASA